MYCLDLYTFCILNTSDIQWRLFLNGLSCLLCDQNYNSKHNAHYQVLTTIKRYLILWITTCIKRFNFIYHTINLTHWFDGSVSSENLINKYICMHVRIIPGHKVYLRIMYENIFKLKIYIKCIKTYQEMCTLPVKSWHFV